MMIIVIQRDVAMVCVSVTGFQGRMDRETETEKLK